MNVALNRPSFVCSEHYMEGYGTFHKGKANDGDHDSWLTKVPNSCLMTVWHTNPWWAVDLGSALAVVGVLFTNRAEGQGNYQARPSPAHYHL